MVWWTQRDWRDEWVSELRRLKHLSAQAAATHMNEKFFPHEFTKNSIIGKRHRMRKAA